MQHLHGVLRRSRHVHVLHLEPEVTLRDETVAALVDGCNEVGGDNDAQLLSLFKFVVEDRHTLPDRLVVVHMGYAFNEVPDVKFLL